MLRLECPHCDKNVYSDHFVIDEIFSCPYCETNLKIDKVTEFGAYAQLMPEGFIAGIFNTISEKSEINLSQTDLKVFGNILASSLDIKNWSSYPKEELENFKKTTDKMIETFPENDPFIDILRLRLTLLDLFLNASEKTIEN